MCIKVSIKYMQSCSLYTEHTMFALVLSSIHPCTDRYLSYSWREDIPSHIDLGKNKYGVPFTTEEVEDVKTFLLLLFLLLSLFGFHLADNGYSAIIEN